MNATRGNWQLTMKTTRITLIGWGYLLVAVGQVFAESGMSSHVRQISPMKQDSLKVSSLTSDVPRPAASPTAATAAADENGVPVVPGSTLEPVGVHSYDPSGRRDPFMPVLEQLGLGLIDPTLPPLQRVGLTEMNLIAVVWGAYGYMAMIQTPDGKGYTVRRGTRIGPNNGVVSAVTEKGIVVQERFTDVYGSKQEREYVKLLHPKEGAE